jgi:hypothetical protein
MKTALAYDKNYALNAICPYYTMFPLEYPLQIIRKHKGDLPVILDPFCGRGTTIYAARKLGLKSFGFDTSPIAVAIARAKLASASLEDVIALGETLVAKPPKQVPETPFFERAFSKATLRELCSLREGLIAEKKPSDASAILCAAALGCLHGPMVKSDGTPSYFSNQMPRTFASKPDYSVRFWKERDLFPPKVSVMDVISKKLKSIPDLDSDAHGRTRNIRCSDARKAKTFVGILDVFGRAADLSHGASVARGERKTDLGRSGSCSGGACSCTRMRATDHRRTGGCKLRSPGVRSAACAPALPSTVPGST